MSLKWQGKYRFSCLFLVTLDALHSAECRFDFWYSGGYMFHPLSKSTWKILFWFLCQQGSVSSRLVFFGQLIQIWHDARFHALTLYGCLKRFCGFDWFFRGNRFIWACSIMCVCTREFSKPVTNGCFRRIRFPIKHFKLFLSFIVIYPIK